MSIGLGGMTLQQMRPVLAAWAQMDEHKAKVRRSERMILDALRQSRQPFVAYSGGKDSTVMLHLVLQQVPGIMVHHVDWGPSIMPRNIAAEILDNARHIGATNVRVEECPERSSWGAFYFGSVVPRYRREGFGLVFVGIRADESLNRRRRIARGESLGPIPESWPLKDWSSRDVWAYIMSRNLPYGSPYDKYVPMLGLDLARFVSFFDPEMQRYGASSVDAALMWRYKHRQ